MQEKLAKIGCLMVLALGITWSHLSAARDIDELAGISWETPFKKSVRKNQKQTLGLLQRDSTQGMPSQFVPTSAVYDSESKSYFVVWYSSSELVELTPGALLGKKDESSSREEAGLYVYQSEGLSSASKWILLQKLRSGVAVIMWYGDSVEKNTVNKLARSIVPLPERSPIPTKKKYPLPVMITGIFVGVTMIGLFFLLKRRRKRARPLIYGQQEPGERPSLSR